MNLMLAFKKKKKALNSSTMAQFFFFFTKKTKLHMLETTVKPTLEET